jgi:hypothetical protein
MDEIVRIVDVDARALDERVCDAVARQRCECVVRRMTWWYTNRPPVHEARVLRAA